MHCKGSTGYHYGLMLSKHIVPALGELPVAEVERKHILALQYGLSDKPRWRTVRWTSWYICSLHRELQRAAARRAPERGDLLHP